MLENQKIRPAQVIGPLGEPLTLDQLAACRHDALGRPPQGRGRRRGCRRALSVDEACKRYSLSLEEFTSWQRAVDRSGMPGLRVTRIKHYRDQYERQQRY